MKVVVTGANGFIGRNLRLRLSEIEGMETVPVTRETTPDHLRAALSDADAVVHLAGVNRPEDPAEFATGNADQTAALVAALGDRAVPVIYSSSTQAEADNPYGASKRAAEDHLRASAKAMCMTWRLPASRLTTSNPIKKPTAGLNFSFFSLFPRSSGYI